MLSLPSSFDARKAVSRIEPMLAANEKQDILIIDKEIECSRKNKSR